MCVLSPQHPSTGGGGSLSGRGVTLGRGVRDHDSWPRSSGLFLVWKCPIPTLLEQAGPFPVSDCSCILARACFLPPPPPNKAAPEGSWRRLLSSAASFHRACWELDYLISGLLQLRGIGPQSCVCPQNTLLQCKRTQVDGEAQEVGMECETQAGIKHMRFSPIGSWALSFQGVSLRPTTSPL
jgi:hypothetical protein